MKNEDSSIGGPALMIGLGEVKDEPKKGKQPGEICIPVEKLKVNDGEEDVEPAPGDIVNPDMKVTRVQDGIVYMEAVDGMKEEEKEMSMEEEEGMMRKMAEESDKMGGSY
jgi:hypothetical protein